jgi:fumarate reductase subunit C
VLPTPTVAPGRPAVRVAARRWHARLDLIQSATGLALAAFLVLHTLFVGTLLLGPEAFDAIVRLTELTFLFGHPVHAFHVLVAGFVAALLLVHAVPALRKFPAGYREYQALRLHLRGMRHPDSTLWYWQVVTGLLLFFLASVHLYAIITQPDRIGAAFAVTRIVDERAWLLYVMLTPIAQFHTLTGLYRLALKWGLVRGEDPCRTRVRLRWVMWGVMAAFIALGLATLTKELHAGLTRPSKVIAVTP